MIDELELIFKALADKNRLRILMLLSKKDMCVCELVYVIGISQSTVSKHLKKLVKVGLIFSIQDGLWTNYKLNREDTYLNILLADLPERLKDDSQIRDDLENGKHANRTVICSN